MVNFIMRMQTVKSRMQEICGTDDLVSETDEFQGGNKEKQKENLWVKKILKNISTICNV